MALPDLSKRLLYRDGLLLVIDKPAGIAVHAGPSGGLSLEAGFDALRFGLPRPPALAHRLDRDTSGCLALGRHPKALRKLAALFREGRVEKVYWALVMGAPPEPEGQLDRALEKMSSREVGWRMRPADKGGLQASTRWRTLGSGGGLSWLELRPLTGRTHQIRVHCAALGCPILGDPVYATTRPPAGLRLHLRARSLRLPLYRSKEPVAVTAPLPDDMAATLAARGFPLNQ
ncbi:RluA family pseudouridine synthase [Aquibaculum arenosum]|uniref:RNA pseudouridine synthase n=1 Tax=Aquibaculum arenosum TaxID=3032591 RepID=A0ABT5YMC2_9PROT|nr:RNA pseudouridine synthase [Fodinicurvata sp. CAU 1616]MDF2096079.1 RNA pseudouridine synthase [Fodinicurvata sp. CAU 1616]